MAIYLERHGVEVYRGNGQKTKDLHRFVCEHAGSYRIDSRVLTNLYTIAPHRLVPFSLPDLEPLALHRALCAADRGAAASYLDDGQITQDELLQLRTELHEQRIAGEPDA